MPAPKKKPGIAVRHSKMCGGTAGGTCSCRPTYQAKVFDSRNGGRPSRTFDTLTAAEAWREEQRTLIRRGEAPIRTTAGVQTLQDAFDEWHAAAKKGTVRKRNRERFAPSTLTAIKANWRLRLKDEFGHRRIDRLSLTELQEFVDRLEAEGVNPGTIESTILPLRVLYRRAKTRGDVRVDPTDGLELPMKTSRGRRLPPAPADAYELLGAVSEADRAVWATAMLAGLRRGELLGLKWEDVDLENATLRVERNYHPEHGFGPPKSAHGLRTVPVLRTLLPYLREHRLRTGRRDGLVFGKTAEKPFDEGLLHSHATRAWTDAGLERVTLHQCRHLYASLSIAAGVNAHSLSKYMGHSSIAVTFDLYGHLFPGNEAEAAALLDGYLDRVFVASGAGHEAVSG